MAVPVYTFVAQPTSINKSSSTTFNVTTTLTPDGTTIYWTINNSTSVTGDFTDISGSFTVTSSTGSFLVSTTGVPTGGETFTISLHYATIGGTVYGTSSTITIIVAGPPIVIGPGITLGPGITINTM
jgi:hypothetical protein